MDSESDNWMPLENDVGLINQYVNDLGFQREELVFQELMSTQEWAFDMVGQPTRAMVFLYPIKEFHKKFREEQVAQIETAGQVVPENLYYMKQYAENACGTIAIFHSLMNLRTENPDLFAKDSILEKFYNDTLKMTPEERGTHLNSLKDLKQKHRETVVKGETEVSESMEVNNHFIAFIEKGGYLLQMDGHKQFPINHGKTTADTFLADAVAVVKSFMDLDQGEIRFSMTLLGAPVAD